MSLNLPALQEALLRTDHVLADVPVSMIRKVPGHNPRRARNAATYEAMKASVAAQGILTPVLLRFVGGEGFDLAAGETRLDIAVELGLATIPANIREMSDEEFARAGGSENVDRANMSPLEEAHWINQLMATLGNDRDAVAEATGFSRKKVERLLLLTHAVDEVNTALVAGEITLGHAELLCGCTGDIQRQALKAIRDERLTVEQTSERVERLSLLLARAPFDKSDCAACPHNTGRQASLFETHLGEDARCLDRSCYAFKATDWLTKRTLELAEEHYQVKYDRDVTPTSHVILRADGASSVGTAQMAACRSCNSCGAVVSTRLDSLGAVTENVCFDLACHAGKVADHQAALAAAAAALAASNEPAPDAAKASAGARTGSKPGAKAPAGKSGKTCAVKTPAPKTAPTSLNTYFSGVLKSMATKGVRQNAEIALAVVLNYVSNPHTNRIRRDLSNAESLDAAVFERLFRSPVALKAEATDRAVEILEKAPLDTKGGFCGDYEALLLSVIVTAGLDPVQEWVVGDVYLQLLTKGSIFDDLEASGFMAWAEQTMSRKEVAALKAAKRTELISTVLSSGFDFRGYLPALLAARLGRGSTPVYTRAQAVA